MRQTSRQGAHQRQAVGAFEVLLEFFPVLDVAKEQNTPEIFPLRILQRRDGQAHGYLAAPASDEVSFSASAFLMGGLRFLDQTDQPRLPSKKPFQRLLGGARQGDLRQGFGRFVEKKNLSFLIDCDYAVFQVGEYLLPGNLSRRRLFAGAQSFHRFRLVMIANTAHCANSAGVGGGLALAVFAMVKNRYTLGV